jgi:putative SOS response-associated peptidase YedK
MKVYSIATASSDLALRTNVAEPLEYGPVYQARPGMKMPLIIYRNDRPELVSAMWGMRSSAAYNSVHMNRVLKSRPWNILIRRNKCAIPANCIVAERNGEAFLIRLPQHRLFLLAGVYQQKGDDYFFTVLETESADIISSITPDMPVFFPCDRVLKWLQTDELDSIFRFADKAGNNWFDYFRVDSKILDPKVSERDLLIPLGLTHAQYLQRKKQTDATVFEKERANRRNFK